MSISEYAPDVRMTRDVDVSCHSNISGLIPIPFCPQAKSYISDYNNVSMPYSNDDVITGTCVYMFELSVSFSILRNQYTMIPCPEPKPQ